MISALLLKLQWTYRELMDAPASIVEAIVERMVESAPPEPSVGWED